MKDQIDQDNVVVIEERDKRTYLYIAIASVFGLAIGGLVGSAVTQTKWEAAYNQLQTRMEKGGNMQLIPQEKSEPELTSVDIESIDIESEVEKRVAGQLENELRILKREYQAELEASQKMVIELEKVNVELEEQIKTQKETIEQVQQENARINQKADMQSVVFERSRELFQRELKVKQALEKLQQEREELEPKQRQYKKDCDSYLEGNNWDVSADSCDKQDEVNSRLSQIDQMIEVYKLDLRQIQQIAGDIGL